MDLYCVKCRARTGTINETTTVTKNNRNAITGNCVTCGTKKFRFVSLASPRSGTSKPVISQPKPKTLMKSKKKTPVKKPKKTPVKKNRKRTIGGNSWR